MELTSTLVLSSGKCDTLVRLLTPGNYCPTFPFLLLGFWDCETSVVWTGRDIETRNNTLFLLLEDKTFYSMSIKREMQCTFIRIKIT